MIHEDDPRYLAFDEFVQPMPDEQQKIIVDYLELLVQDTIENTVDRVFRFDFVTIDKDYMAGKIKSRLVNEFFQEQGGEPDVGEMLMQVLRQTHGGPHVHPDGTVMKDLGEKSEFQGPGAVN